MDKIHLKGLTCLAKVGVFDWERRLGCRCEVDLEIWRDLSVAGQSDLLEQTLDYSAVHRQVVELAENCGFKLLERLAEEIAALVLSKPGVEQVRVLLKKKQIFGSGPLDYAGVDITRGR